MNNNILKSVSAIFMFLFISSSYGSKPWPVAASFVALEDGEWKMFVVPDLESGPVHIKTSMEPRASAYSSAQKKLAYIAADGSLHEINLKTDDDRVLVSPNQDRSYTQPVYSADGERLFVVEMKNGTSVDTDIGMFGPDRNNYSLVVKQRSAQFDPSFQSPNILYYSNVHCTVGCSRIIQEIWRIYTLTKEAEQITLLNAISRQPVLSHDGEWLYFSSDKGGHYHIWRLNMKSGEYQQVTEGVVTDINPALDEEGNLYFIRQTPQDTQVMRLSVKGEMQEMSLPGSASDVRELEIDQ